MIWKNLQTFFFYRNNQNFGNCFLCSVFEYLAVGQSALPQRSMPPRPPCCCLSAYHPQSQRPARWKPGYLRGLSTPSRLSRQGQQHSLEELVGFLVVLGDVSILMEPEYFRVCCDREGPEVLNVGLERKSSIGIRAGPLGSRR